MTPTIDGTSVDLNEDATNGKVWGGAREMCREGGDRAHTRCSS